MIKILLKEYKDLLSCKDLAKIFDTTTNTIYKEIQRGKFGEPIKIGRAYKIPKSYILSKFFMENV